MREIVDATSVVWIVERTRWPVSAAASAIRIVSGSRISPTTITSGACRTAARSAAGKSGASTPISTCSITLPLCWCSSSIGSSIVTMCLASRRLISSTMAASVVVLPEPVGPPTSTRPRGSCASSSTVGGRPSVANRGTRAGSSRTAAAARPRSRCRLMRKRPMPGDPERRVGHPHVPILPTRVRREGRQHGFLDVEPVERSLRQRNDLAVHAD